MASITDIKRRILELAPAPFQEFCDTLLFKMGYGVVHGYGMKSGTGNTTKGNPDTYYKKENAFLQLDESWIQKYSDVFWEKAYERLDHDCHRQTILWKSDDYMKYFDFIFNHYPQDLYRWRVSAVVKDMLSHAGNDCVVKQRQKEWLTHFITENAEKDSIGIIFDAVCELDDETRRVAIKTFLESNSAYDSFEKLTLIPNHWSGNGSFIPAYQRQIDFLNTLLPLVSDIGFLRHRLLITGKIERLQGMIKREEAEEIYRKLYM